MIDKIEKIGEGDYLVEAGGRTFNIVRTSRRNSYGNWTVYHGKAWSPGAFAIESCPTLRDAKAAIEEMTAPESRS